MIKKEMIAMLLAGGQGSRLGVLTAKVANLQLHLEESIRLLIFHLVTALTQALIQ